VPLDEAVDVSGTTAVLNDASFSMRRQSILDTIARVG
jgi:hypothetical protein